MTRLRREGSVRHRKDGRWEVRDRFADGSRKSAFARTEDDTKDAPLRLQTSAQGTPNVGRYFQRHVERAGLRRVRFHDLRPSAASILLAQGVALRTVMEILGIRRFRSPPTPTHTSHRPEKRCREANERGVLVQSWGSNWGQTGLGRAGVARIGRFEFEAAGSRGETRTPDLTIMSRAL